MKRILLLFSIITLLTIQRSFAQKEGQLMVTFGMDAYKTDNDPFDVFNKFQMGLEANYFIANKFSLGLGLEWYSYGRWGNFKYLSFSPRLYPVGGLFLRAKPLIPLNRQRFDVGLGLGYDFMLGETWAVELVGDYYVDQSSIALRLGLAAFF